MPALELAQDLSHELQERIRGDIRFDRLSRQLYSTDASCYQIMPTGVVIPRDGDDIAAVIETAGKYGVSVVPRGAGTSLSGQSVGVGVILDHSRYVDRILEINPEERWVKAESGVVLDHLNRALREHELMYGPDPASGAMATLGGITGNNSTGMHSVRYGMTADHVEAVEVILSDGNRVEFRPRTAAEVAYLAQQNTLEGKLYREIPALVERYREQIVTHYPQTWRNVAGYNLNYLLASMEAGDDFNLAPLIVGSEGTLANIVNVTLRLVERPRYKRLMVLQYEALRSALESVPLLLEAKPEAVELIDRFFMDLTRPHTEFGPRLEAFIEGDPRSVLVVELADNEPGALAAQAEALEKKLRRDGYRDPIVHCTTPEEIENVWIVRKAGGGLLMGQRGDAKPWAFADDATVPIEEMPDFAEDIEAVCAEAGTSAAFFAHVSAGCLHINPVVNLKTAEGLELMQTICSRFAEVAIAHKGTTTGEHGEGIARGLFNEQLYGRELHQAFREVKGLFDSDNVLNPGKIIDAPAPWTPDLLMYNPDYQTPLAFEETYLDFSADGGFAGMVEMCYGQGACRRRTAGTTMCPSFRATRDETHSTRGRANALRLAMTGQAGPEGMTSKELYEVLDLCLECKACQRECPSLVDMAKLRYEFLAQYMDVHGVPLRSRLFAHIATINRVGSKVPRLANWGFENKVVRRVLDRTLGIDERRGMPLLAETTFQAWFAQQPRSVTATRGTVILWDDTYLTYNDLEIGQAAVRVLEALGFEVQLMMKRKCCGRPMISKGLLKEARKNAAHNVALLAPLAAQGIPIIGVEPSCIAAFKDEYPDLLRSDEARLVAKQSFFIEEFLAKLAAEEDLSGYFSVPQEPRQILVHGHCYQKALMETDPILALLRVLPKTTVEEIPSGCCGMAGSFGYEKEHYELAQVVGEDVLLPAVRAAEMNTIIAAAGTSCRHQIKEGAEREALHPIVILAEALRLA